VSGVRWCSSAEGAHERPLLRALLLELAALQVPDAMIEVEAAANAAKAAPAAAADAAATDKDGQKPQPACARLAFCLKNAAKCAKMHGTLIDTSHALTAGASGVAWWGLYKFANPVVIRRLKAPGFIQPLNLRCEKLDSSLWFLKCNLYRYSVAGVGARRRRGGGGGARRRPPASQARGRRRPRSPASYLLLRAAAQHDPRRGALRSRMRRRVLSRRGSSHRLARVGSVQIRVLLRGGALHVESS
jgi:hypothetical protein